VAPVANSLAFFAFALPLFSLVPLLNNVFFAQKNTRTPLLAGFLGLLVAVASAKFLAGMESASLASAYALASLATFSVLFFFSVQKFKNFSFAKFAKILFASACMGALLWFLTKTQYLAALHLIWEVGVITIIGGGFYLILARVLGLNPHKIC